MTLGLQEAGSALGEWLAVYPPAPGGWRALGEDVVAAGIEAARLATSPDLAAAAAGELADKGRVYALVRGAGLLLGTPSTGRPAPVPRLLRRAYAHGDFAALWLVEGLGHDAASRALRAGRMPHFLRPPPRGDALPAKSLLMLHAGLGLALAEDRLDGARTTWSAARVRRRVAAVVEAIGAAGRPGYRGAAAESLGLVSGLFHPPSVAAVAGAVDAVAPAFAGFFWHGVGRALYFRPGGFVPGSLGLAFAAARRMATDRRAYRNLIAGLAWALTLVNQRSPWIVEALLADLLYPGANRGGADEWAPGFANGVASAVVMRAETTPGAGFVEAFCDHRSAPRRRSAWRRLVADPCRRALADWLPALRRAGRLDEVFRYHPGPDGPLAAAPGREGVAWR